MMPAGSLQWSSSKCAKFNINSSSYRQQRGPFQPTVRNTHSTVSTLAIVCCATATGRRSRSHAQSRDSSEPQQPLQVSVAADTDDSSSTTEPTDTSSSSTVVENSSRQRTDRPSKQHAAAAAIAPAPAPASSPKRTRGRPTKQRTPLPSASEISQQLVAASHIPPAVADKLAAAQLKDRSVPQEFDELKRRVLLVLGMFNDVRGATALHKYPRLVATRPEVLARHLLSWTAFFEGMSGDPEADETRLLEQLISRPQLLTVNVENLVGNLYEIGAILQAEDLHMFAAKAMKLALMRPEVVQEKMRRVLLLLNSEARMQQPRLTDSVTSQRTGSMAPAAFSYSDVQKAVRRDYRWLMLSTETLEARLLGLQQVLQVPLVAVGRVFVLQPSLVNKTTQHIADKYTAFAGLPGLEREQAKGAVLAFPALLNLRSEVLSFRWQQLQEAAATSTKWQHELDNTPAGSLPRLLTVTNSRYDRLKEAAARGQQASRKIGTLLHMSDSAFDALAAKHLQPQPQPQPQQQQATPPEKENIGRT